MIASFARNFIFIRTRKTASTSSEIIFGTWCAPGDIQTPVGVDDELTRLTYGGEPQNFAMDPKLEIEYRASLGTADRDRIAPLYKRIMGSLRFHHHMSAVEVRELIDGDFWQRAFKFTVERHPYEKAVSLIYWRNRARTFTQQEFSNEMDRVIEAGAFRNFDLYAENGRVIVDQVVKYEQLQQELVGIAARIGANLPSTFPKSKSQYRQDRRPARAILNSRQKSRIQQICNEEFKLLGYLE